jgi:hypothetical protein
LIQKIAIVSVRKFLTEIPSDVLASLRVEFTKPKVIDALLKQIKQKTGIIRIERHKWCYSFWHGETEFNEFLKQLL